MIIIIIGIIIIIFTIINDILYIITDIFIIIIIITFINNILYIITDIFTSSSPSLQLPLLPQSLLSYQFLS